MNEQERVTAHRELPMIEKKMKTDMRQVCLLLPSEPAIYVKISPPSSVVADHDPYMNLWKPHRKTHDPALIIETLRSLDQSYDDFLQAASVVTERLPTTGDPDQAQVQMRVEHYKDVYKDFISVAHEYTSQPININRLSLPGFVNHKNLSSYKEILEDCHQQKQLIDEALTQYELSHESVEMIILMKEHSVSMLTSCNLNLSNSLVHDFDKLELNMSSELQDRLMKLWYADKHNRQSNVTRHHKSIRSFRERIISLRKKILAIT